MVLKSRVHAPDWSANGDTDKEAKCRKHPLPTKHDTENDPWFYDEIEAASICNGDYDNKVCPFRQTCLHISLVNNEQSGVFGGLLPIQRRWIRKNPEQIEKFDWPYSEKTKWATGWRDLVPSVEFLEAEAEAAALAKALELEA